MSRNKYTHVLKNQMFHKFENSWKRQIHIYKYVNFYKAKRCTHTNKNAGRDTQTQNERQVHMSLNFLVRTTTRLVFWFAIYKAIHRMRMSQKKMCQRQNSNKWIRESYSINSSCNWLIKWKKSKWMLSRRKSGNSRFNDNPKTLKKKFNHSIRIWRWHSNSFHFHCSWLVDCVSIRVRFIERNYEISLNWLRWIRKWREL